MMWPTYCTEWIWRRRSRGVREEGRIPRCSRTAGVELKMEPDDPRIDVGLPSSDSKGDTGGRWEERIRR